MAHAYLFVGPRAIGKTEIARTFARILQCPHDFCRQCPTCVQIEKNIHQDTIQLLDDKESIKINTIRDVLHHINLSPHSTYKIVIIENIDRLTLEAAHALLKTLEEPPSHTIFIGTIYDVRSTLPTIISRMRLIHFKKPTDDEVRCALLDLFPTATKNDRDEAIALSFGAAVRARSLLENPESLQELKKEFDRVTYFYEHEDIAHRFMYVGGLTKEEGNAEHFLEQLLYLLHSKLLISSENPLCVKKIVQHIETVHQALELLGKNVNTRLLLERVAINLVQ